MEKFLFMLCCKYVNMIKFDNLFLGLIGLVVFFLGINYDWVGVVWLWYDFGKL